jgi:peptidyl-prolyl cis-trans isomerase C
MAKFFREPLVHFMFIGTLLFISASFINNKSKKAEKTIVISNEKVGSILRFYQLQNGNLPTKRQLDAMIDDYVKEEIFYRESLNLRLDRDDEIIRRRLSEKMEFLQNDLNIVPNPGIAELRQFYLTHPALFRDSGTVSFTHIYFSADKSGLENARRKAMATKNVLQALPPNRAPEMGDPFALQYDYTRQNKLDIVQLFGKKPILDTLFISPLHQWVGPVESGYGWHLVWIQERLEPKILPFESVKGRVLEDYVANAKDSLNSAAFEKIKQKYIVQRDYLNYE